MTLPDKYDPAETDFDLFSSPFYLIAHADFKYHEDLDKAIAKLGVDRVTYRLLTVLMRQSPMNIKELSKFALLKRSTASRALVRLRKEGWINQYLEEADNRITNVELTLSGRDMAEKVMRLGSRQLHRAVQGLDQENLKELTGLLKHLVNNLSKLSIE
ncbi:hypothetical protein GCM10009069_29950 [Algimonas arctica]|uniref:HTH marR-type domain-containing protein n=1 Tax=Algimonas arctica TaxID=1479486 RepID=A0A8J3CUU8_9PROT|nr:MarR family transcriptional regulator [Algimonas arctica]GHB05556.1 hypothetical protein GCM10009069_29950 [Algimonas arctica]